MRLLPFAAAVGKARLTFSVNWSSSAAVGHVETNVTDRQDSKLQVYCCWW
jgi:hypothetical protein